MNIQTLALLPSLALISLITAAAVLILWNWKLLKRLKRLERAEDTLKKNMHSKARELLEKSYQKSLEIINSANFKASQIISKTSSFSKNSRSTLVKNQTNALETVSAELIKQYTQTLEELEKDSMEMFQNVSENIENTLLDEVKEFENTLRQKTVGGEEIIEKKIEEEYKDVKTEIETYKENQFKKIDQSIYEIIFTVSKLVLGKGLKMEDQQNLIIDALNQAKADIAKSK